MCRPDAITGYVNDGLNIKDRINEPSVIAYVRTLVEEVRKLRESENGSKGPLKPLAHH